MPLSRQVEHPNHLGRWDEGNSELLVDHQGQDAHLGGTALVQFNSTLLQLGGFIKAVPAEVKGSVAEVTNEFSSSDVLHDGKLKEANEKDDLRKAGRWDGTQSGKAVGDGGEACSLKVDVTWKADAVLLDQVSGNSKHGDASMLEFDVTKAVELSLVTVGNNAKRIEEAKRRLGSEFTFEGHVDGDRSAGRVLGRGEGSGAGNKGGKDGELHFSLSGQWNCERTICFSK